MGAICSPPGASVISFRLTSMLTIFTTPKPSVGDIARLQRNAVRSWTLLTPPPEIIVFGDEPGTASLCAELGVRHVHYVKRNRSGTPLVCEMFGSARSNSASDVLCYVNADIILLDPFMRAVSTGRSLGRPFLIVGQRRTARIAEDLGSETGWRELVRTAARDGTVDNEYFIDYFVFSRNLFREIPPFVVGRAGYDNWLIWRALREGAVVIDASAAILAVHQMHGYEHVEGGRQTVYEGPEARQNLFLAEGRDRLRSIADATHVLAPDFTIHPARGGKYSRARSERGLATVRKTPLYRFARPALSRLGLRRSSWDAVARRWERLRR